MSLRALWRPQSAGLLSYGPSTAYAVNYMTHARGTAGGGAG